MTSSATLDTIRVMMKGTTIIMDGVDILKNYHSLQRARDSNSSCAPQQTALVASCANLLFSMFDVIAASHGQMSETQLKAKQRELAPRLVHAIARTMIVFEEVSQKKRTVISAVEEVAKVAFDFARTRGELEQYQHRNSGDVHEATANDYKDRASNKGIRSKTKFNLHQKANSATELRDMERAIADLRESFAFKMAAGRAITQAGISEVTLYSEIRDFVLQQNRDSLEQCNRLPSVRTPDGRALSPYTCSCTGAPIRTIVKDTSTNELYEKEEAERLANDPDSNIIPENLVAMRVLQRRIDARLREVDAEISEHLQASEGNDNDMGVPIVSRNKAVHEPNPSVYEPEAYALEVNPAIQVGNILASASAESSEEDGIVGPIASRSGSVHQPTPSIFESEGSTVEIKSAIQVVNLLENANTEPSEDDDNDLFVATVSRSEAVSEPYLTATFDSVFEPEAPVEAVRSEGHEVDALYSNRSETSSSEDNSQLAAFVAVLNH